MLAATIAPQTDGADHSAKQEDRRCRFRHGGRADDIELAVAGKAILLPVGNLIERDRSRKAFRLA